MEEVVPAQEDDRLHSQGPPEIAGAARAHHHHHARMPDGWEVAGFLSPPWASVITLFYFFLYKLPH